MFDTNFIIVACQLVEMVSLTRLAEILGMPHPTAIGCCNIKKAIIVNPEAYLTGTRIRLSACVHNAAFTL